MTKTTTFVGSIVIATSSAACAAKDSATISWSEFGNGCDTQKWINQIIPKASIGGTQRRIFQTWTQNVPKCMKCAHISKKVVNFQR